MPRKKKSRRSARRSAIAPWVILALSLSVIGFACTRTPPSRVATPRPSPPAVAAIATPPATATPSAPVPATVAPSPTAAPAASAVPTPRATPVVKSSPTPLPAATSGRTARLALIIDDCGQWPATERGFIALPVALTLSVLPDVRYNQTIEREAVANDKGVMLHLPMETLSGLNPGPGKVTTEMDDAAIVAAVEHDLGNVAFARGVNNHEGSKATANVRVMNDVMRVLSERNRFFIDSRTNPQSVAERIAAENGVATAGRDIFLDNRADVTYTENQLRSAAAIALRDGSAIAIGHPRPTTLAAVRAMIPQLESDGVKFVLASDLTR